MKNFFIILFAAALLFFNIDSMLAANSDYKNNLLKITLSKIDSDNYNLELYTQKNYNEPIKIIKKSDTLYYFLLPETSHSITSVSPLGDIENVLVKSYPYAGQDLDNGYTKVAIITSKPLNLTTTLKTADVSVSPRLNPLRLAKLDEVFEKYAQRLAENNIPTPLAEFRKNSTDSKVQENLLAVKTASSVEQKNASKNLADTKTTKTVSLAAANKASSSAATTSNTVTSPVSTAAKTSAQASKTSTASKTASIASSSSSNTNTSMPAASSAQAALKTAQALAASEQKQDVKAAAAQTNSSDKNSAPKSVSNSEKATIVKAAAAQKSIPANQKLIAQNVQKQVKLSEEKKSLPIDKQALKTNIVQKTQAKEEIASIPSMGKIENSAQIDTKKAQTTENTSKKQASAIPSKTIVKNEAALNSQQINEIEKQLSNAKPVEVEFADAGAVEDSINYEESTPNNEEPVKTPAPTVQVQESRQDNSLNLLILAGVFMLLLFSYIKVKKANTLKAAKAASMAAQSARNANMKELLKNRASIKPHNVENTPASSVVNPINTSNISRQTVPNAEIDNLQSADNTPDLQNINIPENAGIDDIQQQEYIEPPKEEFQASVEILDEINQPRPALRVLDESEISDIPNSGVIKEYGVEEFEPMVRALQEAKMTSEEQEKVDAFNAYMDSISDEDIRKNTATSPIGEIVTEDDKVLQELYTPIESEYSSDSAAIYEENQEPISLDSENEEILEDGDDSATIVSSSKLTETRGFYLAKFEGATSLVGYIQDDIYVLYNFGNEEIDNPSIQSHLAQENDTDSLYIVKTGGKKLMIKTTPYDMSLEMVM